MHIVVFVINFEPNVASIPLIAFALPFPELVFFLYTLLSVKRECLSNATFVLFINNSNVLIDIFSNFDD